MNLEIWINILPKSVPNGTTDSMPAVVEGMV